MTRLNEYLKIAKAGRVVGVSQNALRAWARADKIPVHRNSANGYWLFRQADLGKLLASAATPVKPSVEAGARRKRSTGGFAEAR